MRSFTSLFVFAFVLLVSLSAVSGFVPRANVAGTQVGTVAASSTTLFFFDAFSAPKDDGTPGDYVCKVGPSVYVYQKWNKIILYPLIPDDWYLQLFSLFFLSKKKQQRQDCGYVYTKGPKAWAAESNDDYSCPPCGAPKRRFKKVPKGSATGKVEVKKSWFGK